MEATGPAAHRKKAKPSDIATSTLPKKRAVLSRAQSAVDMTNTERVEKRASAGRPSMLPMKWATLLMA
jgi:hypothetical protein